MGTSLAADSVASKGGGTGLVGIHGHQTVCTIRITGETGEVIKADSVRDLLPFLFDNSLL